MKVYHNLYRENITLERIFQAWEEFSKGKRHKKDVIEYERHLEDNLFALFDSLYNKSYKHGSYQEFYVRDPKLRHIHKAVVKDRVVHHLVSKILEQIFDPTFYPHSYSCRINKGSHKAVRAFVKMTRQASFNNSCVLFALKGDIKKFFASIDQSVLLEILAKRIKDPEFLSLLENIIKSFNDEPSLGPLFPTKGMPIGNLTSQLFANIYMDPLDQYIKHILKIKHYIRYADDFVILSSEKNYLEKLIPQISNFLDCKLKLSLHPKKVTIRNYYLGIDFLGYVILPYYIIPRTKTRRRIFRKIYQKIQQLNSGETNHLHIQQAMQSYIGYLSHANSYLLIQQLKNQLMFWSTDHKSNKSFGETLKAWASFSILSMDMFCSPLSIAPI